MKITKSQLKEIIKEEVSRLQKKTILENRKKAIIRELRMLNEGVNEAENVEEIVGALQKGMQKVAGKVGLGKSKWEKKVRKAESLRRPVFYSFWGKGPKSYSTWKGENDSKTFLKKVEEVGWTGFAVVYFDYMNDDSRVRFHWVPKSSDMKDAAPSKPMNEKSLDGASDYKFNS